MRALSIHSWPRAILHIDGDCFFASCEIAQNPFYKGKPLITGLERGIVSSLTYEAKALGVTRGMRLAEVKKICPQVIMLPSDYETYSLFSLRMYNIVRRFTGAVEEYSIDECFAELTGLQRPMHMSYEEMAIKIKETLDKELGMTFSLGLATTKVLAKLASKWKKPSGLTIMSSQDIHKYLINLSVEKIWGIGPQTTAYLKNLGITTAYQFASQEESWVKKYFTKPHYEIWQELRGLSVCELDLVSKKVYQSISKTKTFTPASLDKEYVFSQLSKNVENACIKARRYNLFGQKIFFFLKTQEFKYRGLELKFARPSNLPLDILATLRKGFEQIYQPEAYRATGVILLDLQTNESLQLDLFANSLKIEKMTKLFLGFDDLAARYGKHIVFLGSSFQAMHSTVAENTRNVVVHRKQNMFKGENMRKRLDFPMLGNLE